MVSGSWPITSATPPSLGAYPVKDGPDRHREDLFVGVCVEAFERQSAFRLRDSLF